MKMSCLLTDAQGQGQHHHALDEWFYGGSHIKMLNERFGLMYVNSMIKLANDIHALGSGPDLPIFTGRLSID